MIREQYLNGKRIDVLTIELNRLRHDNSHKMVSERITMNIDLSNQRRQCVGILDFLECHILALTELQQILLPVYDLKATFCINLPNIARV